MSPLRKIGLILLSLVLLPALAYMASRVHSLSQDEALIEQIYDQQLETMLFSVNQHAWDVADSWARDLEQSMAHEVGEEAAARAFLKRTSTVQAVFVADTLLQDVRLIAAGDTVHAVPPSDVALTLAKVQQLAQRKRVGYRQLEPLVVHGNEGNTTIALVFYSTAGRDARVLGMVLDAGTFVSDVLTPKLQDVARERFTLGVFARGQDAPIYATGELRREDIRQQRTLWLFDDYTLGIRLSSVTVEEVLQRRFYRDLGLIILLAVVLLVGALVAYRNVRREVELARIKSDFVSNVSHELRTPLSLIRMYVETLEMGRVASNEQRQHYYHVISQETLRLSRLINNILNFSRIESGRKRYKLEPTDLNGVVRDVLDRYTFTLKQQGFETAVHLDVTLPLVLGDTGAMAEVLINLIDNAAKYSADQKLIELTTGSDEQRVYVEVADHGIGIAPEDQSRIFEAFYRASDSLVHDTKGTGLGLTLVKHIMDAHGGEVTLQSRPGRGSRFRLSFKPADPVGDPVHALQNVAST